MESSNRLARDDILRNPCVKFRGSCLSRMNILREIFVLRKREGHGDADGGRGKACEKGGCEGG